MQKFPNDAVIVSACRTPIGKLRGKLSSVRPDDLLALVFREAVVRASVSDLDIDEAIAGCANQAGEDNRNIARMSVLLAGLPQNLPAMTVNRLCASGLEAIVQASRSIRTQDAQVMLVGGVESMSRAPWVMGKPEQAFATGAPSVFDTSLGWRFPNAKMAELFPLESMGETAENIAEKYGISRSEQDEFAFASHQKTIAAPRDPSMISVGELSLDEGPRADTSLEKLASLKPAFRKNGTVTAGNSSTLNDGAAALVLTSRKFANERGLKIKAVIRSSAAAGVDPCYMGIGPVSATQKALDKINLKIGDIELVELNEAFAAQSIAVMRELKLDPERVNIYGGAIAIGHPLGCSGARLMTTLIHAMEMRELNLGLVTLCVGVGQGLSVIVERE